MPRRSAPMPSCCLLPVPDGVDAPSRWVSYVVVENIAAAVRQAELLGASLLRGPVEIPGQGTVVMLRDPQGAEFAMWEYAGEERE